MTAYHLSPAAEHDLEDIWLYTREEWSTAQADKYTSDIMALFPVIAAQPQLGQDASNTRAGYRKRRAGSHMIFYRQLEDIVEIIRVLHQRMDFEQHL